MRRSGEDVVNGNTYPYWTDRLLEWNKTYGDGDGSTSDAKVMDGSGIAAHINRLNDEIRQLQEEIAELRGGARVVSTVATTTSTTLAPTDEQATDKELTEVSITKVDHDGPWRVDPGLYKIYAIKVLRSYTGIGLREAKNAIELVDASGWGFFSFDIRRFDNFQKEMSGVGYVVKLTTSYHNPDSTLIVRPPT